MMSVKLMCVCVVKKGSCYVCFIIVLVSWGKTDLHNDHMCIELMRSICTYIIIKVELH